MGSKPNDQESLNITIQGCKWANILSNGSGHGRSAWMAPGESHELVSTSRNISSSKLVSQDKEFHTSSTSRTPQEKTKKKQKHPTSIDFHLLLDLLAQWKNHARSLHVLRDGGVRSDPVLVHQGDQLAFLPRRRPMIHEWRISWPWLKTRVGMRSGVTIVPNSCKPKANQFNRC